MESAVVFRSFNCVASPLRPTSEKPGVFPVNVASFSGFSKHTFQGLAYGWKLIACPSKIGGVIVSCAKASEANLAAKSADLGDSNGAVKPEITQKVLHLFLFRGWKVLNLFKVPPFFAISFKPNVEPPKAPAMVGSPTLAPAERAKLAALEASGASGYVLLSSPANPTVALPIPSNHAERAAKLAALEASGTSGYVLVSSPTIGSFQRARTPKRKKQAPIVKEGDLIKEG